MQIKEFVKNIVAKIANAVRPCDDCDRQKFLESFESGEPYETHFTGPRAPILRVFPADTKDHLLKWHQDPEDRLVTPILSNGWKFQYDNELPITMTNNIPIQIPKGKFHRIIKGNGELILEIRKI